MGVLFLDSTILAQTDKTIAGQYGPYSPPGSPLSTSSEPSFAEKLKKALGDFEESLKQKDSRGNSDRSRRPPLEISCNMVFILSEYYRAKPEQARRASGKELVYEAKRTSSDFHNLGMTRSAPPD